MRSIKSRLARAPPPSLPFYVGSRMPPGRSSVKSNEEAIYIYMCICSAVRRLTEAAPLVHLFSAAEYESSPSENDKPVYVYACRPPFSIVFEVFIGRESRERGKTPMVTGQCCRYDGGGSGGGGRIALSTYLPLFSGNETSRHRGDRSAFFSINFFMRKLLESAISSE